MEQTVSTLLMITGLYLSLGFLFALGFVTKGVQRIDPTAGDGASWGFRLAILPAAMVFWPMLLKRWLSGQTAPPEEKSPHRCAACGGAGCRKEGGS